MGLQIEPKLAMPRVESRRFSLDSTMARATMRMAVATISGYVHIS